MADRYVQSPPASTGKASGDHTTSSHPVPVKLKDMGDGTWAEVVSVGDATLNVGDIEIGAVELKNGADDTRGKILAASTPAAATDTALVVATRDTVMTDVSGTQFAQVITSSTITRPNDGNAYASGDLVANSTTAGSVTPFTFANAVSSAAGMVRIERLRIRKSGTSLTNASFRVHLYNATVTVANGDNGAWSTAISGYIGAFDVTVDRAFTDGSEGAGVPLVGNSVLCKVASGTTLYALIEARAAYTPAAQETFTVVGEFYRW